jgi:hypothetical protein
VTLVSNIPPDNDSFDFNASDPVYINSRKKTGEASSSWLNLSRFTRKELVFLGVGVGMGAIATLIGCIIALVVFSPFSNK